MPEYRRFIAYFYEYIDGKKQKNAGFAKVELRNGMWRILFRLTTGILPEPPIQAYGFVREKGYLLGFPMGTMPNGCEIAEEWAYRAENPIGFGKYRLEDLSGIWIRSGEQRCFITVWDDDPIDPERFVLELPAESEQEQMPERVRDVNAQDQSAENAQGISGEEQSAEITQNASAQEQSASGRMQDQSAENAQSIGAQEQSAQIAQDVSVQTISTQALKNMQSAMAEAQQTDAQAPDVEAAGTRRTAEQQEPDKANCGGCGTARYSSCLEEMIEKRTPFMPFSDNEIAKCVQIMPCDIVRMQQENWPVGRSTFLLHGYYQHRHLLLGITPDGTYVLGVPGIRSQQEQYMARMFGYDRFKMARVCDCGRVFGYWYRLLPQKAVQ